MKILRRYIGLTIMIATLFVLLVLLGLQIFISFLSQLNDIGAGQYGMGVVLKYVALTVPGGLYNFFPMAGLLGSLIGLGYLASNSELVVMRAAGVSLWQIIFAVLAASLLMLVVITSVGELAVPFANKQARNLKTLAVNNYQLKTTRYGLWLRRGNNFIYIKSIEPGKALTDVSQYVFDNDHRLKQVIYSARAFRRGSQWFLQDIHETILQDTSTLSQTVAERPWSIDLKPALLEVSHDDANEMTLPQLRRVIGYRQLSGLSTEHYALAYWQRVFQPFATLIMIFLGIPFIFGPLRTVTMGVRILSGAVVGFSFYLANQFFGPISLVYQVPAFVGAVLPSCLFLMVGVFLLARSRK